MLTAIQNQVIALLAQGLTITAAARSCDVDRTTVHHWKRTSPEFLDSLRDAREDAAAHARALYVPHVEAALAALLALMNDPKTPATVRLKAAFHILQQSAAPVPPPESPADRQERYLALCREQRQQDRDAETAPDPADHPEPPAVDSSEFNTEPDSAPGTPADGGSLAGLLACLRRQEADIAAYEAAIDTREAGVTAAIAARSPEFARK